MQEPRGRILLYEMDEEALIRRIGGAVVTQWTSLPTDLQELIHAQACVMFDRQPCDDPAAELTRFIERYRMR